MVARKKALTTKGDVGEGGTNCRTTAQNSHQAFYLWAGLQGVTNRKGEEKLDQRCPSDLKGTDCEFHQECLIAFINATTTFPLLVLVTFQRK